MRSTELREQLLKQSWREKLRLREYVQQRYDETVRETPELHGESKLEAQRRQLFYLNMIWFMTTLLDRKDRMSMGGELRGARAICRSPSCGVRLEHSVGNENAW
ncbi:hypothetical protein GCM10020331_079330 [Ectobacillus funiculus]